MKTRTVHVDVRSFVLVAPTDQAGIWIASLTIKGELRELKEDLSREVAFGLAQRWATQYGIGIRDGSALHTLRGTMKLPVYKPANFGRR